MRLDDRFASKFNLSNCARHSQPNHLLKCSTCIQLKKKHSKEDHFKIHEPTRDIVHD